MSLVEFLIAVAVLAFGMLSHAATSVSSSRLLTSEARHGDALRTVRHFTERLRSDVVWAELYGRLRANFDGAPGRLTHAPSAYFPDFKVPAALGQVRVMVEAPRTSDAGHPSGFVLREDIVDPRFDLPHDLNGDGAVDAKPRNDDYTALPVIITFEWVGPGDAPQRFQFTTWLRGERP